MAPTPTLWFFDGEEAGNDSKPGNGRGLELRRYKYRWHAEVAVSKPRFRVGTAVSWLRAGSEIKRDPCAVSGRMAREDRGGKGAKKGSAGGLGRTGIRNYATHPKRRQLQ